MKQQSSIENHSNSQGGDAGNFRFVKAEARRNRLLGVWAAGMLGKEGEAVAEYAKEVVRSDFDEPGEEDVFRKIRTDFDAAGIEQSDEQIRTAMASMMREAVEQIEADT